MFTYLLKRLLAMIPTLFGITLITFFIVRLAPGDPVEAKMGGGAGGQADSASGAETSMERKQDTIKAKKKLLGMMEEQYAVLGWDAEAAVAARTQELEDKYKRLADMKAGPSYDDGEQWPRVLIADPAGKLLYAGLRKGAILALPVEGGDPVATFEGHTEHIRSLAVAPGSTHLVSGDSDGKVLVRTLPDGKVVGEPGNLPRAIRDIAFLPDGKQFLTACGDGVIRLHDMPSGTAVKDLRDHNAYVAALQVSQDGKRFWSGGYDRKLREWSLDTMKVSRVLLEHGQAITDIDAAPDESFLATASEDRVVRVLPLPEGEAVEFKRPLRQAVNRRSPFSPDGTQLIFRGAKDETVRLVGPRLEARARCAQIHRRPSAASSP